jgi:hypothetical protein
MNLVDSSGDWETDMLPNWPSNPDGGALAIALRKSSWLPS